MQIDIIELAVLLYLTGGLDNPFAGSGQTNIFPLPTQLTSTTPWFFAIARSMSSVMSRG